MRSWTFPLSLDSSTETPLFVQISRAIARDIARGRLVPGDRVPGTRTLAQTLGVHRSTVVAAYAELGAQGWTETKAGGATLVAVSSPDTPRRFAAHAEPRARVAARTGFTVDSAPMAAAPSPPVLPRGAIALWGGVPDVRLLPIDLLTRAYRRSAKRYGHALLGYGNDPRGHLRLRTAVGQMVSAMRGLSADPESIMITRGSQMAIDLVVRSLVRPGDVVLVEALGYAPAFNAFRRAEAEVVPIAVDRHGIDVGALSALARRKRVRLIYVTPHHQYPTTVMLSQARRLELLDLARRERIAILEDDYDQEFHYDGRPVLPLASSDPHGSVIYVGTLAKILAPGLRLGFVVAQAPLLARMAVERTLVDRQGDAILECAVAELLEDGEIQRHVRRTRRIYHQRRDDMCRAVDEHFAGVLSYQRPAGGLALWTQVAPRVDLDLWQKRAMQKGVYFQIGRQFTFDGSAPPFARFGYAMVDERELALAVRRLSQALTR
jgi:GntR family transcriptional regulator / MocR family aminotransferase